MSSRWLALAACLAVTVAASPALAECNRGMTSFDMPAQRLDDATQQLAHRSGCFVRMNPAMVADRHAPAIKGRYTPEQALALLVRGTAYTAYTTSDGLAFDHTVLDVTMSQSRVLRTALQNRIKAGTITTARAGRLRMALDEVDRTLPRQVNTQGMLTDGQRRHAVDLLEHVRSGVGLDQSADGWNKFKHRS